MCWPCWFRRCNPVVSSWESVEVFPMWPTAMADDEICPWMRQPSNFRHRERESTPLFPTTTYSQSWKIFVNSLHMVSFKCLAFACVIWPDEKSKTSSLETTENDQFNATRRESRTWEVSRFPNYSDTSIHWFCSLRRCRWWNSAISLAIRVSRSRRTTLPSSIQWINRLTCTRMTSSLFR